MEKKRKDLGGTSTSSSKTKKRKQDSDDDQVSRSVKLKISLGKSDETAKPSQKIKLNIGKARSSEATAESAAEDGDNDEDLVKQEAEAASPPPERRGRGRPPRTTELEATESGSRSLRKSMRAPDKQPIYSDSGLAADSAASDEAESSPAAPARTGKLAADSRAATPGTPATENATLAGPNAQSSVSALPVVVPSPGNAAQSGGLQPNAQPKAADESRLRAPNKSMSRIFSLISLNIN